MIRQNDGWDDVRDAFVRFTERLEAAPEIVATGFKSFTWDFLTQGKLPPQAIQDIRNKITELDRRIAAHHQTRRA